MMTDINKVIMSNHARFDHLKRKSQITEIVGENYGRVIAEQYYNHSWYCLTDKGLIFILDEDKTVIITFYLATVKKARRIYGKKRLPDALERYLVKIATKYDYKFNTSIKRSI